MRFAAFRRRPARSTTCAGYGRAATQSTGRSHWSGQRGTLVRASRSCLFTSLWDQSQAGCNRKFQASNNARSRSGAAREVVRLRTVVRLSAVVRP